MKCRHGVTRVIPSSHHQGHLWGSGAMSSGFFWYLDTKVRPPNGQHEETSSSLGGWVVPNQLEKYQRFSQIWKSLVFIQESRWTSNNKMLENHLETYLSYCKFCLICFFKLSWQFQGFLQQHVHSYPDSTGPDFTVPNEWIRISSPRRKPSLVGGGLVV